jgi:hypothetical protein
MEVNFILQPLHFQGKILIYPWQRRLWQREKPLPLPEI